MMPNVTAARRRAANKVPGKLMQSDAPAPEADNPLVVALLVLGTVALSFGTYHAILAAEVNVDFLSDLFHPREFANYFRAYTGVIYTEKDGLFHRVFGAGYKEHEIIHWNPICDVEECDLIFNWNPKKTPPKSLMAPFWTPHPLNFLPEGSELEDTLAGTFLGNKYTCQLTGEVETTLPIAYQQERIFRPQYHKTQKRLHAILKSDTWQQLMRLVALRRKGHNIPQRTLEQLRSKIRAMPVKDVATILRITNDMIILDGSGLEGRPLPMLVDELRAFVRLRTELPSKPASIAPPTMDSYWDWRGDTPPRASLLYIHGGRSDWYPGTTPFWAKQFFVHPYPGINCPEHWGPMRTDDDITADTLSSAFVTFFAPDVQVDTIDVCGGLERLEEPGFLDSYDAIVWVHQPSHALLLDKMMPHFEPIGAHRTDEAMVSTKAVVWPSMFYNFNNNKSRLQNVMRDAGLPWVPNQWFRAPELSADYAAFADRILKFLDNSGWGCMLLKASYSSVSQGILRMCTEDKDDDGYFEEDFVGLDDTSVPTMDMYMTRRERIAYYISYIKYKHPANEASWPVDFTAFRYIKTFKKHYQLRTFWNHGEPFLLIGDKGDVITHEETWSWLKSEGGVIDDDKLPLDQIYALGRKATKALRDAAPPDEALPPPFEHIPSARVDFGCCLDASDPHFKDAQGWFVNEVEPISFQLTDLASRQIMRVRGCSSFDDIRVDAKFDASPYIEKQFRRSNANWAPVGQLYGMEMLELALAARAQNEERERNNMPHAGHRSPVPNDLQCEGHCRDIRCSQSKACTM